MKTLLISAVVILASVNKPSVEFQYLHGQEKPIGAIVRTGIFEFTEKDGTKSYWVTGKTLQQLKESN